MNPSWNQTFELEAGAMTTGLLIEMYDDDLVGSPEFMGRIVVPPSDFKTSGERWIKLEQRTSKDEVKGDICIKTVLKPL